MVAYFLTGEPRAGKTTALKKVVDALGVTRCGGFYTEEVLAQSERCGFRLVTLAGATGMIADVSFNSSSRVGRYGVFTGDLESIGVPSIYEALESKQFIIIDEIGPMQLLSERFKHAVMTVLESTVPIIGTIFSGSHIWVDEIKQRNDVRLFTLTSDNRDEVTKKLIDEIGCAWFLELRHHNGQLCWMARDGENWIVVDVETFQRVLEREFKILGVERKTWNDLMEEAKKRWKEQCDIVDKIRSDLDFWRHFPNG